MNTINNKSIMLNSLLILNILIISMESQLLYRLADVLAKNRNAAKNIANVIMLALNALKIVNVVIVIIKNLNLIDTIMAGEWKFKFQLDFNSFISITSIYFYHTFINKYL